VSVLISWNYFFFFVNILTFLDRKEKERRKRMAIVLEKISHTCIDGKLLLSHGGRNGMQYH